MILTAKFDREKGHESREMVLGAIMGTLVTNLVKMRDGDDESDVDYSRRAVDAISEALDTDSLLSLIDIVPSIQQLIPEIRTAQHKETNSCHSPEPSTQWQLVFLLSELLVSVLGLERKIILVLDDLQWADKSILSLMSEGE